MRERIKRNRPCIAIFFLLSTLISVGCGRQAAPPKKDINPPTVISTTPANKSLGNPINTAITIIFNEIVDPSSVTSASFQISDAKTGSVLASDVTYANSTIILKPSSPLLMFTVYAVQVTTDVRDVSGNTMLSPMTLTFTTGSQGDLTPPDIAQTVPDIGAVDVGVNSPISITFTEPMLATTITTTPIPIIVTTGMTTVPGSISVFSDNSRSVMIFSPDDPLSYSTTYSVVIADSIADLAGNHPQWNNHFYTWEFTTQNSTPDTTRPHVLSTIPTNSANNVSVNTAIITVFDETMLASSVTSSTFLVTEKQTGVSVPGGAAISGATAAFSPASSLRYATEYLVTLVTNTGTTGITDLAGNLLVANSPQGYAWSFMTETLALALTVTKTGTGSGIVTASTGTLAWAGNTGTVNYADYGTVVTLTAAANSGSTFTGWSGEGCAGTGTCTVIMTQARSFMAAFTYDSYPLTATKAGTGTGIVTASTGTLTWTGNTGTATYTGYGTVVTLTAAANNGSTFTGWSGEGCTGTGTCTVTMTAARNVTATFTIYTYPLTVTRNGNGSGLVTANTGVLAWNGKTGSASYNFGTQVLLTAAADPGSIFTDWTGCDSVNGNECAVSMTAPRSITATFAKQPKK